MTERNQAPESEDAEAATGQDVVDPERGAERADNAAADERPAARSGRGLAWLAMLLALAACGLAGWQWWQARVAADEGSGPGQERIEALAERVGGVSDQLERFGARIDELDGRVSGLDDRLSAHEGSLESIRDELSANADQLADQGSRIESLSSAFEQRFERLAQQIDERPEGAAPPSTDVEGLERRLALIEAAALLRLGQSRAQLADDRSGAVAAYRRALDRLEGMTATGFGRLRNLVADELAALESLQLPEWDVAAEQVEALEDGLSDWPRVQAGTPTTPEVEVEDSDSWWQGVRRSMSQLVRVSPRDEAALSPAVLEILAERLRLHLLGARIAIERRDAASLSSHLEQARALAERGYDASDPAVQEALATFETVAELPLEVRWPTLGGALDEIERQLDAS